MKSVNEKEIDILDKVLRSVKNFEADQRHDWKELSLLERRIIASRLLQSRESLCNAIGLDLVADTEKKDGPPIHLVVTDVEAVSSLINKIASFMANDAVEALLDDLISVTIFEKIDKYLDHGFSSEDIDELIDATLLLGKIENSVFETKLDSSEKLSRYAQYVRCKCIVEYSQFEKEMRMSLDEFENGSSGVDALEELWSSIRERVMNLDVKANDRKQIVHLIEYILSDFGEVISTGVNKYSRYLDTGFYRYNDHDKAAAKKEITALYKSHNHIKFQINALRNMLLGKSHARGYNFYEHSLLI